MSADERHARQRALPEVGEAGQRRLEAAVVRVHGAELSSRVCALYLAGAGVGRLELAEALVDRCRRLNPDVDLRGVSVDDSFFVEVGAWSWRPGRRGSPVDDGARGALKAMMRIVS